MVQGRLMTTIMHAMAAMQMVTTAAKVFIVSGILALDNKRLSVVGADFNKT